MALSNHYIKRHWHRLTALLAHTPKATVGRYLIHLIAMIEYVLDVSGEADSPIGQSDLLYRANPGSRVVLTIKVMCEKNF